MAFFRPLRPIVSAALSTAARRYPLIIPITKSLNKYREACGKLECALSKPKNVIESEYLVPLSNTKILINVYRPANISAPYPTTFYIPGTSLIACETNVITRKVCGHIAAGSGFQQVVIHHRLLSENPFPIPVNDAFDTVKMLLNNPALLNIDLSNVVISGYSSGGSIATLTCMRAIAENLPIKKQILISPQIDLTGVLDKISSNQNKDKVISKCLSEWFTNLREISNRTLKNFSPHLFSLDRLAATPPTDIYCGTNDFFLNHTQAYAAKLKEAGVSFRLSLAEGEDHGAFWQNEDFVKHIAHNMSYIPTVADSKTPVLFTPKPRLISASI